MCALVGPNGAGKTTTFGVVGGYIRPDRGEISLLGQGPFAPAKHRGRVALLPQDCELNPHTPVGDSLVFLARLQGMSKAEAQRDTERVLELVDLRERSKMRIRQLSHGMRRRVSVAQAFLGSPELVLLDEPTAGLDPSQVRRLRELFVQQRGQSTLVISSHVLAELEQSCDFVVLMEAGRCVRSGPMDALTAKGSLVRVRVQGNPALAAALLPGLDCELQGQELLVRSGELRSTAQLNAQVLPLLLAGGVHIVEVRAGESLKRALLS